MDSGILSILYNMVGDILHYDVNFEQDLKEEKEDSCKSLEEDYSRERGQPVRRPCGRNLLAIFQSQEVTVARTHGMTRMT